MSADFVSSRVRGAIPQGWGQAGSPGTTSGLGIPSTGTGPYVSQRPRTFDAALARERTSGFWPVYT